MANPGEFQNVVDPAGGGGVLTLQRVLIHDAQGNVVSGFGASEVADGTATPNPLNGYPFLWNDGAHLWVPSPTHPLPVTPAATEAHLGAVGGALVSIEAHFARPNDTVAYAANDALSDSASAPTAAYLTFTGMARVVGGSGYITKALLNTDLSTCTLAFRLHLFNAAPATISDNSPMTVLFANRTSYIGALTFPAAATEGTGSDSAYALDIADRLPFVCAADANLYGLLETLNAGVNPTTQKASQNFSVKLTVDQN